MIFLSLYFRFITRDWLGFQIFTLIFTTVAFLATLLVPESPKYLYSYKKYKEARKALMLISKYNRVDMSKRLEKYHFDTEQAELDSSRTRIPIIGSFSNGDVINRSTDKSPMTEISSPLVPSHESP